jgi:hypothetical protein
MLQKMISEAEALTTLQSGINPLIALVREQSSREGLDAIKAYEIEIDKLTETHRITSKLSRAKRALRGDSADREKAIAQLIQAGEVLLSETAWRQRAGGLATDLQEYEQAIATTLGMRMQQRLGTDQAESIASCLAIHKDLSLHF